MTIRHESAAGVAGIRRVVTAAFGDDSEARLVDRLRASGRAVLSLVAIADGRVAGHVMFSPVSIDGAAEPLRAAGLAPLAVAPSHQRQAIGARLVEVGLVSLREARWDCCFVLGAPDYYSRFGFVRAADFGYHCAYPGAEESFMVVPVARAVPRTVSALVRYAPEFDVP